VDTLLLRILQLPGKRGVEGKLSPIDKRFVPVWIDPNRNAIF
jgi:hypothetical protein